MKSTRLATLCLALGLASFLTLNSRAAVYNDASNDLFNNGFANLDITGVEVTNNGVNLVIAVTTRAFDTWTKYLIWIDTPANANAAANSNGWGRPASMASGEGADFFIGSWVDATPNNVQLWNWNGTSWAGPASYTTVNSGNTVTYTIPLSALGLSAGNVIKFDVATSGGGADPGVDHASRNTSATTGWTSPSTGGPMLSYTITAPSDSDGDGLADTWENTYFNNLDQTGSGDPDSDNLNNAGELAAGTNPTVADTDSDGLNDGAEVTTHTTNPTVADTDGDGVNDGAEITAGTNPKKTNYSQITVAGGFQGWSPSPTNSPSNIMTKVTGEEFGWELNFRMATATNYLGKFTTGSWDVNWGTSGTPGTLQMGGFGNDIPFNVAATGIWRFYFNTDTLSYSFTRVPKADTYADWAFAMGVVGAAAEDDDSDGLANEDEYFNDIDPLNSDTDGDSLTDAAELLGYNDYSIATSPISADTDGDGLLDNWELQYGLDPTDDGTVITYVDNTGLLVTENPNGANGDPDNDNLTNEQEQSSGENPLAPGTGLASSYAKVVVAGSFVPTKPDGSWDQFGNAGNTMQLVSNFTWKLIVYVPAPLPTYAQFKFTTGSWDTNFGDDVPNVPGGVADGIGDLNGSNINALPTFTAAGYYMITFNDFSKAYSIAAVAATDTEPDGLPDEWEAFYGGYLDPKTTDLDPAVAYVTGGLTAAQAYAAGANPVADTVAPTIALAGGVDKLTWVANGGAISLANTDVTVSDDITSSPDILITINPETVDTATDGLTTVTYTATDGGGNASSLTRVIAVGDAEPGYRKLYSPNTASISTLGSVTVNGRIYIADATPGSGQAPNITAELGVNTANTDPSTWTGEGVWIAATHNNGFTDGDDEYQATISGSALTAGTYYYAFRFKIGNGAWRYAGINAGGTDGGPWDETNGSGTLTVSTAVARNVTFAVDMGVQIFKGTFVPGTDTVSLVGPITNWETGTEMVQDGETTVYKLTIPVEGTAGATPLYKFKASSTLAYEGDVNPADPAEEARVLTLGEADVDQNLTSVFFNNLEESRRITFRVDMSKQIEKGAFTVGDNTVSVAGSFNGWNGAAMSAQGNGVYALEVLVDGPLSGVEYKFYNDTGAELSISNRTIADALPNLEASTLDPVLFNNDDGIGPVITLNGDNPLYLANGATWSDPGATAEDVAEGTSTNITGTGDVNTLAAGEYTVTYSASDAAGNAATPVTRTVVVADAPGGFNLETWLNGETMSPAVLSQLAIGGASSATANDGEEPVVSLTGGQLVISAIVRTNSPAGYTLSVVGQAVTGLADYSDPLKITSVTGEAAAVQGTVPEGCERQEFKVNQDGTRKFLRLKATLSQ